MSCRSGNHIRAARGKPLALRALGCRSPLWLTAPPWTLRAALGRLGYIRRTAFYVCVTRSESRFHVCRKRVRNSVPNPPNLFRTFRTFSYDTLLSGGPFNGPPRQVVLAGRRHNCRPSRQSGGCAPRPPLMPKGSGFGVRDSRGETQYSEPCGFGMSPLAPSRSQLCSMFGPAGQKNGSLTAPKSGQGKRCGGDVAVAASPPQYG